MFLQGLFPPSNSSFEVLGDGTLVTTPGGGDQFPIVHTVNANSPETIWLRGDDSCPQNIKGFGQFVESQQFKDLQSSTMSFYESFQDILDGVIPFSDLSYLNAYEIYDYINVGVIHNATITKRVSAAELKQLRILADSREWALNGNITSATPNPISVGGSTLATRLLGEITVGTKLPPKRMSVFFGSYDTFLSFFALTSLPSVNSNFRGLPDYGSTIAFELFSTIPIPINPEDFSVRFLFRNGTAPASVLREYPLFGRPSTEAVMGYPEFRSLMDTIAIQSVPQWCDLCVSQEDFCPTDNSNTASPPNPPPLHNSSKGMKPEIAGVLGAMCTLAAALIVLAILMLMGVKVSRKKKRSAKIEKLESTSTEKLDVEV